MHKPSTILEMRSRYLLNDLNVSVSLDEAETGEQLLRRQDNGHVIALEIFYDFLSKPHLPLTLIEHFSLKSTTDAIYQSNDHFLERLTTSLQRMLPTYQQNALDFLSNWLLIDTPATLYQSQFALEGYLFLIFNQSLKNISPQTSAPDYLLSISAPSLRRLIDHYFPVFLNKNLLTLNKQNQLQVRLPHEWFLRQPLVRLLPPDSLPPFGS